MKSTQLSVRTAECTYAFLTRHESRLNWSVDMWRYVCVFIYLSDRYQAGLLVLVASGLTWVWLYLTSWTFNPEEHIMYRKHACSRVFPKVKQKLFTCCLHRLHDVTTPEVSAEDFDLSKYSKLENMMSSIKYYFWASFTLSSSHFLHHCVCGSPSLCR